MSPREELLALYRAGLSAVDAEAATTRGLGDVDRDGARWTVLAVGKAAVPMARAALERLGERAADAAVWTRDATLGGVIGARVREAGHPLPDERSVAAAREALRLARPEPGGSGLLVLLSGGASALWCAPAAGLELGDKREATEALLRSGAPIAAINRVRRALSDIKGGGLARAAAGRELVTLAISDVRGDAPADIGSGPTWLPDAPPTEEDALAVVRRLGLESELPPKVIAHLKRVAAAPAGPVASAPRYEVVASLDRALTAMRAAAEARGLGVDAPARPSLYGDVEDCARRLVQRIRAARAGAADVVIDGGEPDVAVRGDGRGGRMQELALRLAVELEGDDGVCALCAGTDGSDGPTDAAGAYADGASVERVRGAGVDPRTALANSDSHAALDAAGDLLRSGPTHTNVADVVIARIRHNRAR